MVGVSALVQLLQAVNRSRENSPWSQLTRLFWLHHPPCSLQALATALQLPTSFPLSDFQFLLLFCFFFLRVRWRGFGVVLNMKPPSVWNILWYVHGCFYLCCLSFLLKKKRKTKQGFLHVCLIYLFILLSFLVADPWLMGGEIPQQEWQHPQTISIVGQRRASAGGQLNVLKTTVAKLCKKKNHSWSLLTAKNRTKENDIICKETYLFPISTIPSPLTMLLLKI